MPELKFKNTEFIVEGKREGKFQGNFENLRGKVYIYNAVAL